MWWTNTADKKIIHTTMKRKIIETEDGSTSFLMEEWGESFHSIHGAIQEAQHVYIENGLRFLFKRNLQSFEILEIGFGTGLNCFMTLIESEKKSKKISYTGIEGFPLIKEEWGLLNYNKFYESKFSDYLNKIHVVEWEKDNIITQNFNLIKHQILFDEINFEKKFDLVYFDAFGFQFQPELWSEAIFKKIKKSLKPDGIIVTYACKGAVNRILKNLDFKVEKLDGPPGKRQMTRATLS